MNRPSSVSTTALTALALLGFALVYGVPLAVLHVVISLGWHA
ncbi:hypothetical protein QYN14_05400 [Rhodococcus ruber]|nr:hypothetical protein [Rhodococcus ruber]WKK13033.1 hypothetical protein QYN14_05400 [Rhodococcus ruber]